MPMFTCVVALLWLPSHARRATLTAHHKLYTYTFLIASQTPIMRRQLSHGRSSQQPATFLLSVRIILYFRIHYIFAFVVFCDTRSILFIIQVYCYYVLISVYACTYMKPNDPESIAAALRGQSETHPPTTHIQVAPLHIHIPVWLMTQVRRKQAYRAIICISCFITHL